MTKFIQTITKASLLYNIYIATLITLFTASVVIEKGLDVLFINSLNTPWLDLFFSTITNLGDGAIFIFIFLITLFISFQHSVSVILICVSNGLIVNLFKHIIFPSAQRPKNYIDNKLLHFVQHVDVHSTHSFPSGHTVTAFCAALFITLLFNNNVLGIICLILAVLTGLSRIYLLQHFLMDVAAGATIGCVTTYIIWQAMNATQKPKWMNRRLSINYKLRKPSIQVSANN